MKSFTNRFSLERLVTFCDAVVAIALTLLVLDIKVDKIANKGILTWGDLIELRFDFVPYFISFVVIGVIWSIHNQFFQLIRCINTWLFWTNMLWLFFISLLPFMTRLVGAYPNQVVSTFLYASNTMGIALCLNAIWDYVERHPDFLVKEVNHLTILRLRIACNVSIINAGIAMIMAFFAPLLAFVVLLTRPLTTALVRYFYRGKLKPSAVLPD